MSLKKKPILLSFCMSIVLWSALKAFPDSSSPFHPLADLIHHVQSRANVWGIEYLSKWFHLSFHFGSVGYLLTGSRFLISCCSTYNCIINGALDIVSVAKIRPHPPIKVISSPSSHLSISYSNLKETKIPRSKVPEENNWERMFREQIIHTDHQVLSIHLYRFKRNPDQRLLTPLPSTLKLQQK